MFEQIVQEIKERIDYEAFFSRYLNLKRVGNTHMAICPFHPDTKPSLSVDLQRGLWYCFGCNQGGDIFTFLMKIEGISFKEALKLLAEELNIINSKELTSSTNPMDRLAARFHELLTKDPEALQETWDFLADRGIDLPEIDRFKLGYAPRDLSKWRISSDELDVLRELGVITNHRGKLSSPFAGRLIFPIFDPLGKLRGLGGRSLNGEQPKYVNSSTSYLFNKGELLYGLHLAREEMRSSGRAVLVEGYLDVIKLHSVGIRSAVASMGTALTERQAKLLRRYAQEVVILYDSDPAGRRASFRAAGLLELQGIRPLIATLPQGYDPDSFIREKGPKAMSQALNEASEPIEVMAKELTSLDFGERRKFLEEVVASYLNSLLDPIRLSEAMSYLEREGYPRSLINSLLRTSKMRRLETSTTSTVITSELSFALNMFLNYSFFKAEVADLIEPEHFQDPDAKVVIEYLLEAYDSGSEPDLRELAMRANVSEEKVEELLRLLSKSALTANSTPKPEYAQAFLIEKEIAFLRRKLREGSSPKEDLLRRIQHLKALRDRLIQQS